MKHLLLLIQFDVTEKNYKRFVRDGRKLVAPNGGSLLLYDKPFQALGAVIREEHLRMDVLASEMEQGSKPVLPPA